MSILPKWFKNSRFYNNLRDRRYLYRESARRQFYRKCVASNRLVFDIGANVGHYTLILQSLGNQVVAIEPQRELVERLRDRFKHNRKISVEHCGVGSTSGELILHKTSDLSEVASLRNDVGQVSRFAKDHPFTETETVPIRTLSSIIEQYGVPDFCKIDVEGFEAEVLATLTAPIRLIALEFNREYFDIAATCVGQLTNLADYEFNFTRGEDTSFYTSDWQSGAHLLEGLKAHPDPLLWGDIYARLVMPEVA